MRPESSQPVRPGRGSASTPAARPNSRCHSTRWCWRSGSGRVRATASWPGSHVSWVFTRRRLLADRPISRHTACVLQPPPPPALPLRQIRPGVARPGRRPRVRTTGRGRTTRSPARAGPASGAEPPPRIPRTPGRAPRTLDREPQRARNRVRCHGLALDLSPPSRRRTAAVMRARAAVDRYDALTARAGVDNGLEPWQTTTTGRPGRRHLGAEGQGPSHLIHTHARYVRFVRFSFLILIGHFVILEP